jgi:serine/threonine protein phosphatase PrpC
MIEHSGISEQGPVRPNNEDFIACRCPEEADVRFSKGHLFVIADGVGGSMAGEVASREAADMLLRLYYTSSRQGAKALQEAFQQANLHVYDLSQSVPEYRRMQTTLSAIALIGRQAFIGHVGDTRIYQVRRQKIQQLTWDHSEVAELLRMQIITPEEARHHHRRNIITRSIGSALLLQPDFRTIEVEIGDIFVLCTDGLWEPVTEQEIAAAVAANPPSAACRMLIDLAIERKTTDNLSVQVVKVVEWEEDTTRTASPKTSLLRRSLQMLGKKQKGV